MLLKVDTNKYAEYILKSKSEKIASEKIDTKKS